MAETEPKIHRRLVWRRIMDDRSFEECVVAGDADGFDIRGHIIAAQDDEPLTASYRIRCNHACSALSVEIEQTLSSGQRNLHLKRSGGGWLVDGAHDTRLDGCAEPDLSLTPSTNALAIHRLGLAIGQAAEITCAWVHFPALSVEPSLQRYERLGKTAYRYTNVVSGFTATVTVDELALPVTYERIWTRIADWPGDRS